jgi:hypothetical protein
MNGWTEPETQTLARKARILYEYLNTAEERVQLEFAYRIANSYVLSDSDTYSVIGFVRQSEFADASAIVTDDYGLGHDGNW